MKSQYHTYNHKNKITFYIQKNEFGKMPIFKMKGKEDEIVTILSN